MIVGWARAEDMESIIGIVLIMLLVLPFPLGVLIGYRWRDRISQQRRAQIRTLRALTARGTQARSRTPFSARHSQHFGSHHRACGNRDRRSLSQHYASGHLRHAVCRAGKIGETLVSAVLSNNTQSLAAFPPITASADPRPDHIRLASKSCLHCGVRRSRRLQKNDPSSSPAGGQKLFPHGQERPGE